MAYAIYQFQAVADLEKRFMTRHYHTPTFTTITMKSKIIDNRYFLKNRCNDMRTHTKSFYSEIFRRKFIDENFFDESF